MSSTYKRLLNEFKEFNSIKSNNNNNNNINNSNKFLDRYLNYKLYIIESNNVKYRSDIKYLYQNKTYKISIYYSNLYPFKPPIKLEINNENIFNIYKDIIKKNKDILDNNLCLCCQSLLCSNNWNISKNIFHILIEVEKILQYKQLFIKRILLNKIILKYTNQNMDYLEKYLIK